MDSSLVDATVPKRKLIAESETEFAKPAVVGTRLADPDGAGMIDVGLLVGVLRERQSDL
jgi:hypothetical protein